ncbi:MAG: MMPL family transporter [Dehalococcoidia bacterium]
MNTIPSPERLARFSVRHPWAVVGTWAIVLVLALYSASTIGEVLSTGAQNFVETDSSQANDLLEERLLGVIPGRETIVVQSANRTVDDPEYRAYIASLTDEVRSLTDDVASAVSVLDSESIPVSADGKTTLIAVTLTDEILKADQHIEPLLDLLAERDGTDGYTVTTVGDGSVAVAFTHQSEKDLQTAEIYGIPVAIVILVAVFGALVAAGLPLLLGLFSIVVAIGLAAVVGRAFDLSIFMVNFVTTMGLAVGIDYALIIVKRFREEREGGLPVDDAIIRAGGTASRAVLFSGMAVIVALFGMVIVPNSIFRSLGFGAILVVAAAVVAALTLLPAVLRLLGDRVNAIRIRIPGRRSRATSPTGGFWDRTVRGVMARPWVSVIATVGLLVTAALPYATIQLGWSGVSTLPADTEAHRAFEILDREFSAGLASPARIVIDAPDVAVERVSGAMDSFIGRLASDERFGEPQVERNEAGDLAVITVPLRGDPQSDEARDAVNDLRDRFIPAAFSGSGANVLVTGATAEGMDNTQIISDYTIPVFAFVLGLSFLILLVVFRSIVVPIKALVMNLLSVGAAYGLMVLVFQHGVGNELLGFQRVEVIESWVPLFMFAVLFGLSMDYHVFLLTRIREHFDHTGDNTESVAHGVRATAGMITGAAAIMIAVFSGFAAGEMVMFQQMGFGLAVAVLLDATIVRVVLVPASMQLLGARNWYLPSWLRWLPKVDVEGSGVPSAGPAAMPVGAAGAE